MPYTTVLFGVAALGATGLPLGAGFVGEWLLLQSLIHTPQGDNTLLSLVIPLSIGALALTTGLGIVAMVKAFGIGFLARPRSPGAERAREGSPTMLAGMGLAAGACAVIAVAPIALGGSLTRVAASLPSLGGDKGPELGTILRLPGAAGSVSPAILAVALAVAVALVLVLARWGVSARPVAVVRPLWAGGGPALTPRMQYTATSFAEPLQRVFDDVLRPDTDVAVTHVAESRYLIEKITFRTAQVDAVEQRLYWPVVRGVVAVARGVRRVHTGSIPLSLRLGAIARLAATGVRRWRASRSRSPRFRSC
jgi:NADH:ubiquinone oxidoreductase subunit 5 (subunit L)/multisubunit Na+/H+ antiporter MnhA subunit